MRARSRATAVAFFSRCLETVRCVRLGIGVLASIPITTFAAMTLRLAADSHLKEVWVLGFSHVLPVPRRLLSVRAAGIKRPARFHRCHALTGDTQQRLIKKTLLARLESCSTTYLLTIGR